MIKIDDFIRDNDPRETNRLLRVWDVTQTHAWAAVPFRGRQGRTRIRLDRIHTDGKPRRSGWSRVSAP